MTNNNTNVGCLLILLAVIIFVLAFGFPTLRIAVYPIR